MAEVLTAYLDATPLMRWGWGGDKGGKDCAIWMADYVGLVRGGDPAAAFRGEYRTALGCERLLEAGGGLVQVVADTASAIGLAATDSPQRGDIGVIETLTIRDRGTHIAPTAAICLGNGLWAVFSPAGLLVRQANFIAAWAV